jgi:phage terminase large subunit-like protein
MMTPAQARLRAAWLRASDRDRLEELRLDRRIAYDWHLWARDEQLAPPGEWSVWTLMAGRGFGKTRCGAEWVRQMVETGHAGRVALVGPTAADARDVMVEGESGLLNVFPAKRRPVYEPSKRKVTFHNGAIAMLYSAEEPDRLRGPQHDAGWADEAAAWKYAETWDMLQFGMRLGRHPRQVVTTTPKPNKLVREILADPGTVVTRGSTFANAENLAAPFLAKIRAKYEGTRLGRQELEAELLDDNPNALWKRSDIDKARRKPSEVPAMRRIVVAVDPAVTTNEDSDETGIVVAGLGEDGRGYVFDDLTCKESPAGWGRVALNAYRDRKADRIVAEVNQGGDLVETLFRSLDATVSYQGVRASRGKYSRAEPVAALYEQGKVSHVGSFGALEDQMCEYNPQVDGRSPDRMDALVWALTALMLDSGTFGMLDYMQQQAAKAQKART